MVHVRKGQAAMEFLMTYGWALLVVLIAIGALAFFGVLNPSKFLPNSCSLAPGFACSDFKASASTANIIIVIQNGLGDNLYTTSLALSGSQPNCDGAFTSGGLTAITLNDGASTQFSLACPGLAGTKGTKLKGDLIITYNLGSTTGLQHKKVGQLVAGVEA